MKITFFDTETTGTDPKAHAIIQIAGFTYDYSRMEEVGSFDIKVRPFTRAKIDMKALEVNGISKKDLFSEDRLDYYAAYRSFICAIEATGRIYPENRIFLAGYNTNFDTSMISAMAEMCGDRYFFAKYHWPAIDVAQLAMNDLIMSRRDFKKFNLVTVAEHYGWNESEESKDGGAHEALYDTRMTKFIYDKLKGWSCNENN